MQKKETEKYKIGKIYKRLQLYLVTLLNNIIIYLKLIFDKRKLYVRKW